ncbi:hypothetical protein [Oceaniglobus indicus]|uniref:hypothetical protein n=1 Tax=Oceaniglobus indicus TaxID=2047749 RepID=UPI000C177877|nr:hypothetical protein [Oceaniglobus indicus]
MPPDPPRDAPLFLARATYRRRRLMDAARLLPVVGAVLFLLPMLWFVSGGTRTAVGGLYLFAIWTGLIVIAAILSRVLVRGEAGGRGRDGPDAAP